MFVRKDMSKELSRFINSDGYNDFIVIMDDIAAQKFLEMQSKPDVPHADMIADRKILNFYLNLSRDLKFRYEGLQREAKAQNMARIEESQRVEE